MTQPTCRDCGHDIDWVYTVAGKSMPLHIGLVLGGNVVINEDGLAEVRIPDPSVRAHVTHFEMCPVMKERIA